MITAPPLDAASLSRTLTGRSPLNRRRVYPWLQIGAVLGSGLIYLLYLVFVAYLPRHLRERDVYLFGVLGTSLQSLALYATTIGTLFVLAGLVWRATHRATNSKAALLWALVPPIIFGLFLLLTQPLTSRDLYYYIMGGRILGVYEANPYIMPPASFPGDAFLQYSGWNNYTSPYGPLWLLTSAGLARLGGGDLFWTVYFFKTIAFGGYLACGGLIWAILRALGRSPLPGTVFWLWNPLVLLEFPGAGHNDVLMLTGILAGLLLYLKGHVRTALVLLTLAALVKSVALVVLPLALWHHLAPLPTWSARSREALRLLWLPALLIIGFIAPFWAGASTFGPVQESNHYYSSIAHIARLILQTNCTSLVAGRFVHTALLLALGGGYLWVLRNTPGRPEDLLTATARAMLLLIVIWPFFVPWYCGWAVAMVAARDGRRLGWRILILCLSATLSYLCQIYLPTRTRSSVAVHSTLAALLIFVPFALSLRPWVIPAITSWLSARLPRAVQIETQA